MSLTRIEWKNAEIICKEMYADNPYLTPYQQYDFLTRIMKSSNIRRKKEFKKYVTEIYLFEYNGVDQAVLPLCINYKSKTVCLVGDFSSVGHLDFIYRKEFSLAMFEKMLNELSDLFGGFAFRFNRISEFSKTSEYLRELKGEAEEKDVCVKIDFTGSDEWYKGLSKSCRQNIRTSHNRVAKDSCSMEYCSSICGKVSSKLWKDNLKLFSRRICEHSRIPVALTLPMYLFKRNEPLTNALLEAEKNIVAGVYINGNAVAACNGVIGNDGRAIITRLSIDMKWGKYSPGGLLIESMIEEISHKYPFITSIDLSRGDEPYKYTYGGTEHYNYGWNIII